MVVHKFREAKVKSAVFERYIPRRRKCHSAHAPEPAAGPSWWQEQKASVAARAPPPRIEAEIGPQGSYQLSL
ncbi:hypothetical protein Q8A67_001486 [Cirrhinus molitorella]|uniref:Uncharacterized protein n=1 Tax=Cirrhinus molitorella TaxID=172907 RepID=A0AA88Q980_9TELE|nr:hypothetical protein Q8A67_001486 [Cirrhinus molitorella]